MPERVYAAEYGYGGRPGEVVRRYESEHGLGSRIVVKLDGQDCLRDCYASSVFPTREQADAASRRAGLTLLGPHL